MEDVLILGAGITGLSAGIGTKGKIYEARNMPGGICASYYVNSDGKEEFCRVSEESYRFEIGGGHWIFGTDNKTLDFIHALSPVKRYERKSSVYFPELDLYVPYPIQNHLFYLPVEIKKKALDEILKAETKGVSTLADWLEVNFGRTLCELFFFPFHELYTAGLYKKIAPQDKFKTPVNKDLIIQGAKEPPPAVGYNATFVYPEGGLDDLIRKMKERCEVDFNKRVVKINLKKNEVGFEDGSWIKYQSIVSTLPLNKMVDMAEIEMGTADPYTSVLVVNIGAQRGGKCPDDHWIYTPQNKSGFHRVGFYSNVDSSFLPASSRLTNDRVSIYVEKAYPGSKKPTEKEIVKLCNDIVLELIGWGFIKATEVISHTWIDIAYTWQYTDSNWKERATAILKENKIYQTGRYGKWKFQGVAESIYDGLNAKRDLGI